jgi:hypothetical protein
LVAFFRKKNSSNFGEENSHFSEETTFFVFFSSIGIKKERNDERNK